MNLFKLFYLMLLLLSMEDSTWVLQEFHLCCGLLSKWIESLVLEAVTSRKRGWAWRFHDSFWSWEDNNGGSVVDMVTVSGSCLVFVCEFHIIINGKRNPLIWMPIKTTIGLPLLCIWIPVCAQWCFTEYWFLLFCTSRLLPVNGKCFKW